jgi:heme/copper-type cytochrome/quinol oxidase subunit 3
MSDVGVLQPPVGHGEAIDHGGDHGGGHGDETSTGLNHRKMLMWAFLGSDCLFFGSLISTYLVYRGRSVAGPVGHEVFDIPYTSVSSFVLLMSSLTMVLTLAALQRGDLRRFRIWLVATACLGLVFLGGQAYEFTYFKTIDNVWLQTNLFGSTFFTLTGFHGTHVFIGVLWLLSLYYASKAGILNHADSLSVEIAGLYWHFVDIVWIIIFTVVYLIDVPPLHP